MNINHALHSQRSLVQIYNPLLLGGDLLLKLGVPLLEIRDDGLELLNPGLAVATEILLHEAVLDGTWEVELTLGHSRGARAPRREQQTPSLRYQSPHCDPNTCGTLLF